MPDPARTEAARTAERRTAACALLTIGCGATASQVLILRELLVAFQGNELLLGLFLANWLLFVALGTILTRTISDRMAHPVEAVALCQLALGLAPMGSLLIVRGFRAACGIPPGEVLSLPWPWLVSALALAPVAVADGAAFPFACRLLALGAGAEKAAGRAYAIGALGGVVGGLLFLVPFIHTLSPPALAAGVCLMSAASAWGLLVTWRTASLRVVALGVLLASGCAVVAAWPARLEEWSMRLVWAGHELLETARSPYAMIALVKQAEQYTLVVNGAPTVSVPHPGPEVEILAHFPLLAHARPRRILVLGGGAGGLLSEILKHPVAEIAYAEQDPLVLTMLGRLPTTLTRLEFAHPAVRTHAVEGRLFLRRTASRWDVILVNLPAPSTLLLNRFYTQEFFTLARSRLGDDGVLALSLPGSDTFLSPELAALSGSVSAALRQAFPHVRILGGDPTLFVASAGEALPRAWGPRALAERLAERRIRAGLVNAAYIGYRMRPDRFAHLTEPLLGVKIPNRDGLPRGTFASMQRFSRVASPSVARVLGTVDRLPVLAYPVGAALLVAGLVWCQHRVRRPLYVGYAAISTGFAGMVMSLVLILAFQIRYGDVYQYVGVLTALFMLGAAAGSAWASGRGGRPLLAVEAGLLLLALAASGTAAAPWAEGWPMAIFVLMLLVGGAVGAQYPVLVAHREAAGERVGTAAGLIYGLDLLGAVPGAILAGVVFVPTVGVAGTLLCIAALKAGSVILIVSWRRTVSA